MNPSFTIIAIIMLELGIGATTVIFTVVSAVLKFFSHTRTSVSV